MGRTNFPLGEDVLKSLQDASGADAVLTGDEEMAPYFHEERGRYQSRAAAVIRPRRTEDVAAVVRLCAARGIGIVPQGGNTGLVGGAVAVPGRDYILVNLGRLNRIRAIDSDNDTMTVEAGCILARIQDAARQAGRFFPLSLGAEGSCQIGGNLSTNAGGTNVLRFGNARDQVLGLEVVLADGTIWDGLTGLRKDNTGYDLKQLFIGAEGTLGIITAAVVKLYPAPHTRETAFAALTDPAAGLDLLNRLKADHGGDITGFEYIGGEALTMVEKNIAGIQRPLAGGGAHYALLELHSTRADDGLRQRLEATLARALKEGNVLDAVLAENETQRANLWRLRESIPEAQKPEGVSLKHDIALAVSAVPAFIEEASRKATAMVPGLRVVVFGHLGDGNVHFNLSQPPAMDTAAFTEKAPALTRMVHDLIAARHGSISAEHGIGLARREDLSHYKSPAALALMRTIKKALDPKNIMNPGKILGDS